LVKFTNQPQAATPSFLDEPDASAFRLIRKLEVDRLLVQFFKNPIV